MQEVAEEQDAAYIPMPKGRGFTPHFDNEDILININREGRMQMWIEALSDLKKASGKTTKQIAELSGVPIGTLKIQNQQ